MDRRTNSSKVAGTAEWNELIEFSKKFSNANKVKLKYEQILNELTIFQNLIDLGSGIESNVLDALFSFKVQVISDPEIDLSNDTKSVIAENVLISVENTSEIFSFNREFWHLFLDCNHGASANIWKFDKELFKPGDTEKFLMKFTPDFSNSSTRSAPIQEIKISLILSLVFNERQFQRILEGRAILLDILHLLCPGKRPSYGNRYSPNLFPGENSSNSNATSKYPPIVKFNVKLEKSIHQKFPALFLSDSIHRGFGDLSAFENLKEVVVFSEGDKVVATCQEDSLGWSIQCSTNPKVLLAIKVAIFKRLLSLQGLKVEPPSDEFCETLCKLKLRLESSDGQLKEACFHELYLMLRNVSEEIQFCI